MDNVRVERKLHSSSGSTSFMKQEAHTSLENILVPFPMETFYKWFTLHSVHIKKYGAGGTK